MTFRAKYDGHCGECGEEIQEGEMLEWAETQRGRTVVHADCADSVIEAQKKLSKRETCPDCWQEIAVNGSCGCDDS
jgi:hypothetical protein